MATDRHEYWAERWRKQKENGTKPDRHDYWKKRWEDEKEVSETFEKPKSKKKSGKKKDRHRKGYYHDYNQAHPERLERGYTKGYVNGNVSEGPKEKQPNYPDGCIEVLGDGYYIDRMGWKRHIDPLTDMLTIKEQEWHDDDWDEGSWDD
jgi:hypothetical protein